MRERVLAAVEAMGYEQNLLWESLRRGASHTIGMIARDISSLFWADIALGAEMQFQANGYSMLLTNSRNDVSVDVSQIKLLNQRRVDGLLVSPNDPRDSTTIAALARLRVPVVAIDREVPASLGAGAVLIDHHGGVRAAADKLVALGHRSIGFVSPPPRLRPAIESSRALHEATYETGADVLIKPGPFTAKHGYDATRHMLTAPGRPTAIISSSGQAFPGVLRAIRELGLRIPDDVSLLAIDDIPLLAEFEPSMTMVSRQPRVIGDRAASILLAMIDGGEPQTETVPTIYTPGASVGPPPDPSPGAGSS